MNIVKTDVICREKLQNDFLSLKQHSHIALIYDSIEDQMTGVLPFIQTGLERGEHCVYAADENSIDSIIQQMTNYGIDTELYLNTGALTVLGGRETYLRNDVFDPDEMIRFLDMAIKTARQTGFTGFRGAGEASWSLNIPEGLERLIDYESKLDRKFHDLPMRVMCQYNLNLFPSEVLLNVIRTHPLVVYKGRLCENDFHVPQDEIWKDDPLKRELDRKLEKIFARG